MPRYGLQFRVRKGTVYKGYPPPFTEGFKVEDPREVPTPIEWEPPPSPPPATAAQHVRPGGAPSSGVMGDVEWEGPGPRWNRDVKPPPPGSRPGGLPPAQHRRGRTKEERAAAERRDNAVAALCDYLRLELLPAVTRYVADPRLCVRCGQPFGGGSGHGPGFCEDRRGTQ